MNNTIVRWTISRCSKPSCSKPGLLCLKKSIDSWRDSFGNDFDFIVCYNNLDKESLNFLKKLKNVELINQENYVSSLPIKPESTIWKLCPPRINLNSFEIFIDNDLVIYKNFSELDYLFNNKKIIVSAGHHSLYGNFDDLIVKKFKINTGFLGLPPYFDLKSELECLKLIDKKINHNDDQGAICWILQNLEFKIIPLETISITNPMQNYSFKIGKAGAHFTGLNYFDEFRKYSKHFKKYIIKI